MDTTFASSSVRTHLVRGAVGLALIVAALGLVGVYGPVTLLLLLPAGVALRGCPTCWALGLAQTRAAQACPVRTPPVRTSPVRTPAPASTPSGRRS